MVPAIAYLDGLRIRRAIAAGIETLIAGQEHLNKINVFPVADGDTGTNLTLTMSAVMASLRKKRLRSADQMLTAIADAAIDGARGNSGAILAQFFQGVSDAVTGITKLSPKQFAKAITIGATYAKEALSNPKEGTVLTVMRDFADALAAGVQVEKKSDFVDLFAAALARAKWSLANTTSQLEVLRKASVVDAGAEGFVRFLDGIDGYISHGDISKDIPQASNVKIEESAYQMAGSVDELDFRYCTECIVTGQNLKRHVLREELLGLGGSLVLAGTKQKMKVHIHTDQPTDVFKLVNRFGNVSSQKADDMLQQQELSHRAQQRVVVTTDSAADITDEDMERLSIHMIPVKLHFGESSYLDKVSIDADEFFEMLETRSQHPMTSQPSPGEFRRNFNYLGSHYQNVLSVNVTSWGSGTVQSAKTAADRTNKQNVTVYDSKLASVGQALMAIHAAECAKQNMNVEQIVEQLDDIRSRTHIFGLLPDMAYAVRGGRLKPAVKKFADWFHLVPVFSLDEAGALKPRRLLLGRNNLPRRLVAYAAKHISTGARYRLGVAYGTNQMGSATVLRGIRQIMEQRQCTIEHDFTTRLGSALGAHAGPGCLALGIQRIE